MTLAAKMDSTMEGHPIRVTGSVLSPPASHCHQPTALVTMKELQQRIGIQARNKEQGAE
jgi:hypothetical protein